MQFAASSAMVAAPATGNNTHDEPVNVTALKNPVNRSGIRLWMNTRMPLSTAAVFPSSTSRLILIAAMTRTNSAKGTKRCLRNSSDFYDHFERVRLGRVCKGHVSVGNTLELEAVGDQRLRVELVRAQRFHQHRNADGVH